MYYTRGIIDYNFLNGYLKNHIGKKGYKIILDTLKDLDDSEKFMEIISFQFSGIKQYYYNEIILISINDKYIPVFVENINTSSPYALSRLYQDFEEDDDEINDMELDEFVNCLFDFYDKDKIKKTVNEFLLSK